MRVAVTGANGFIGKHVVEELNRRSINPVLIVRPSGKVPELYQKHTIVSIDLKKSPANTFKMIEQPDVLIHLAWAGLPNYNSPHHLEEELPAQYQFLSDLVKCGLKNLVVTGTCFEYGMQSGQLKESLETKPNNPYGFAKDTLRCQLQDLQKIKPFNLTWARLFYLYGEGQSENSLLPQLKKAVQNGDKKFNMSGGEQLRDYLSVLKVAKYILDLATNSQDNGIVNICSGIPISVRSLVESWIKDNTWPININLGYYPYPDYEPMAFWGDSKRLNSIIGGNSY